MEVDKVADMVADMEVDIMTDMVANMVADMEVDIVADMEVDMVADMEVDIMADIVLVCSCQKFAVLGCYFLHLCNLLIEGGPVPLDHLHVSQVAKIY